VVGFVGKIKHPARPVIAQLDWFFKLDRKKRIDCGSL
jgi:hypothetical protein